MKLVHTIWRLVALFTIALLAACTNTDNLDCGNVTETTLAGTGSTGSVDNATGTQASFNEPYGITSDGTNLYVADTGNNKIRKIVIATGAVSTLAGSGSVGSADNTTGTLASFNSPRGLASDGTNLYVADSGNNAIRKIVIATEAVDTLVSAGSLSTPKYLVANGATLYVLEFPNALFSRIRTVSIATGAVATLNAAITYEGITAGLVTDGNNLYTATFVSISDQSSTYGFGGVRSFILKIGISTGAVTKLNTNLINYPHDIVAVGASQEGVNFYVADDTSRITKVNYVPSVCPAPKTYAVTGTLAGLGTGKSVVLRNNSETKVVGNNGVFAFNTVLTSNQAYNVQVDSPPSGQVCTVANGIGTVGSKNIDDVLVTCASSSPSSYTIGGTVSGLSGTVVLQNNGSDNLSRNADGSFTFGSTVTTGGAYAVTVLTQPTNQTCTVTNGSGTASANVSNVAVSCSNNQYFISGVVNNLQFPTLVLQNNGGDDLSVFPGFPAGTTVPFTFATPVTYGGSYHYDVTVPTVPSGQPSGQTCTVTSGGSGTATGNVSDVVIDCTP